MKKMQLVLIGLTVLVILNQCNSNSSGNDTPDDSFNIELVVGQTVKEYFPDGGLKAVYETSNGQKNGLYLEYYEDSTLKFKQYYHNDSIHGMSLTYFGGQIVERCSYNCGKKDGYYQYYWPNGNIMNEGFYTEDEMTGTWLICDDSEKIKHIKSLYPDSSYILDLKKYDLEKKYDSIFNVYYYMPKDWFVVRDAKDEYDIVYQVDGNSGEYPIFYRTQKTNHLQEYSVIEILDEVLYEVSNYFDFDDLYFSNVNQDSTAGVIICKIRQYEVPYIYVMNIYKVGDLVIANMSSFPTDSYVPMMSYFEFLNDKMIHEIVGG